MESEENCTKGKKESPMAKEGEMKAPVVLEPREGMATKVSSSSPCSSPSHEFSFTISFGSPSTASTGRTRKPSALSRCSRAPPPLAVDLAPADDIIFHGHLLPLQLFSRRPPVSLGCSRASIDTPRPGPCPIQQGEDDVQKPSSTTAAGNSADTSSSRSGSSNAGSGSGASEERVKSKYLPSVLRGFGKWWRGNEEAIEKDSSCKKEKKKPLDVVNRALKRYMSAMEPLFSFRSGRDRRSDLRRRPYSFSANHSSKVVAKEEWRRRRGQLSAPASMRTSPTNSGVLLGAANPGSSETSSMEELQNAIQAAIAHCKNSIAMKEEMKLVARQ